jgi:hypothetical protein
MNNNDLKNIIFSFLRKKPKLVCMFCECVCVWDSKVKNYHQVPHQYYNISHLSSNNLFEKNIYCIDCIFLYKK